MLKWFEASLPEYARFTGGGSVPASDGLATVWGWLLLSTVTASGDDDADGDAFWAAAHRTGDALTLR